MAWRDEDGGKMEAEEGREEEEETQVVDRVNWINAGLYVECI